MAWGKNKIHAVNSDFIETLYNTGFSNFNCEHYSITQMQALYSKIFTSILHLSSGIENIDKSIFYDNMSPVYNQRYGLIHYMVDAYVNGGRHAIKAVKKNIGGKEYIFIEKLPDAYCNVNLSDEKFIEIVRDNIAIIEFHGYERYVIRQLFDMMAQVNGALYNNIQVANTPIYKIAFLRDRNSNKNASSIQSLIEKIMKNIGVLGKGIAVDAGDSLEFAAIDTEPTYSAYEIITKQISQITGIPQGFIGNNDDSSLFGSAENDNNKLILGLQKYFLQMFKPVVERVLNIEVEMHYSFESSAEEKIDQQNNESNTQANEQEENQNGEQNME